jgi:ribosomal protein L37AE/L43A
MVKKNEIFAPEYGFIDPDVEREVYEKTDTPRTIHPNKEKWQLRDCLVCYYPFSVKRMSNGKWLCLNCGAQFTNQDLFM